MISIIGIETYRTGFSIREILLKRTVVEEKQFQNNQLLS